MPENIDIFLLMGQSNMAGRGPMDELEPLDNENILMMRHGNWVKAVEPLHLDKPVARCGLSMSFAQQLLNEGESELVGLVACAVGGTSLEEWRPDGYLYRRALFEADEAVKSGTIRGILWHQGESDSYEEKDAATYEGRFVEMMGSFRRKIENESVPVVVGELGAFLKAREDLAHFETINEALRRLPDSFPHTGFSSAGGLVDLGDDIHFDTKSLREFGRRYAAEYLELV